MIEQLKVKLNSTKFTKGDILPSKKEKVKLTLKDFFRWLGFYISWNTEVLSEPIFTGGGWEYKNKDRINQLSCIRIYNIQKKTKVI